MPNADAYWKLKLAVLDAYGGCCACCGELDVVFLTIDHIAGGGGAHRRSIGLGNGAGGTASGAGMYRWLKKNGWPAGFQVLCSNCNRAKHDYGICPHQIIRPDQRARPPKPAPHSGTSPRP